MQDLHTRNPRFAQAPSAGDVRDIHISPERACQMVIDAESVIGREGIRELLAYLDYYEGQITLTEDMIEGGQP